MVLSFSPPSAFPQIARGRWLVTGQVQGVGFRPFVYRLARRLKLCGFVQNRAGAVVIECQGPQHLLDRFDRALHRNAPRLAVVRDIRTQTLRVVEPEISEAFVIADSPIKTQDNELAINVTADAAACPQCVREVLSPTDRRSGHALTNCTQCGPRFSILRRLPYDRCNTTLAQFPMCPTCEREYEDPADRRFHAQPNCCPNCGPSLALVTSQGQAIAGDPLAEARRMLRAGKILGVKGIGGFHLAVRADDDHSVRRLRELKKRDNKPFALMVASIEQARALVHLSDRAAHLLRSSLCPIVLALRRSESMHVVAAAVSTTHRLGVMLPYTTLHHLLMHRSTDGPMPPLVMTSGNLSDEPLVIDNEDALRALGPMVDAFLWHDRPIQRHVDDSVVIDMGNDQAPLPVRRARGYVPRPIELPIRAQRQGICLGAELKNTIAVVRDGVAILSQHLGDLTQAGCFNVFRNTVKDFRELFDVRPRWIAHDLHPAYLSTGHARELARTFDVPLIGVQHHHAHAASLLAEHGMSERILAIVCDGTGFGSDGTTWGGELLEADLRRFRRLGRLRPLRLPGGDAAAQDVSRSALALLYQAYGDEFSQHPAARALIACDEKRAIIATMIRRNVACVSSSGAGRVFDAVAALLGLCSRNTYEAQAAMALESAAEQAPQTRDCSDEFFHIGHADDDTLCEISLAPLVRELISRAGSGESAQVLARLFHDQFATAWAQLAVQTAHRLKIGVIGLSGGVFCNALLTRRLSEMLSTAGLRVLRHHRVPPNDGGISLGQAAVAAAATGRSMA